MSALILSSQIYSLEFGSLKNALSDGKEQEGFAFASPQVLKFPGEFLQWLQNKLERNFERLEKKKYLCLSIQLVVFISPNLDFLQ